MAPVEGTAIPIPDHPAVQPNVPLTWSGIGFSPRFWGVLVAVGIGAGLGAVVLMALLRAVQHLAYDYSSGSFLAGVDAAPLSRRVVALVLAGLIAGIVWYLLRRLTKGGAGLLESVWQHTGELPFLATLVNATTEMVIVGLGASLGREGAPKDAAAALASKLADLARLPRAERRLLVACGAGAGLAAVYNVPLGGALFALEVMLGTLSLPLVLPAVTAAAIATAVAWIGLPDRQVYHLVPSAVTASEVLWAVIFGPLAGLAAVGYIRLLAWAKARKPTGIALIPATTLTFAVVGAVSVVYPQILGNGLDLAQLTFSGSVALTTLAVLAILRPLATGACLRSGALGGLLTPTLCAGAVLGGLAGSGWDRLWPGNPVGDFAVLGALSLLAATMQAPLTAGVLIFELTNHLGSLLVPGLIAVAGATIVSRALDERSIYSAPLLARAPVRSDRDRSSSTGPVPATAGPPTIRTADPMETPALARWVAGSADRQPYRQLPAELRNDRAGLATPGSARRSGTGRPPTGSERVLVAEHPDGDIAGVALITAGAPEARGSHGSLQLALERPADPEARSALIAAALDQLARSGCRCVHTTVSRADTEQRRALEAAGWSRDHREARRGWPHARAGYHLDLTAPDLPDPRSNDPGSGESQSGEHPS